MADKKKDTKKRKPSKIAYSALVQLFKDESPIEDAHFDPIMATSDANAMQYAVEKGHLMLKGLGIERGGVQVLGVWDDNGRDVFTKENRVSHIPSIVAIGAPIGHAPISPRNSPVTNRVHNRNRGAVRTSWTAFTCPITALCSKPFVAKKTGRTTVILEET